MANPTGNTPEGANEPQDITDNQTPTNLIDDVCILTSADAEGISAPIVIAEPVDGATPEIFLQPGQKYYLDFEQGDVKSMVEENGDLTITLNNGDTILLKNFDAATTADTPAVISFQDEIQNSEFSELITVVETVPSDDELEEVQAEVREGEDDSSGEEVAQVEPAAGEETPQELAQIEPAAGDDAGGDGDRGGFGFQSEFAAGPIDPIQDVGPIDPTLLNYGVEFRNDDLFILNQEDPNDVPDIDDNPGIGTGIDSVDETGGFDAVSGQVNFTFGNDGPGYFAGSDNFTSEYPLFSHGEAVTVTFNPNTNVYTGTSASGTVFDLTIGSNGEYTFTQYLQIDHADAGDHDDSVELKFGIEVFDVDGDTDTGDITIYVFDDGPQIGDDSKDIDESNLGPIVVNGDLVEFFGQDGEGDISTTDTFTFGGSAITQNGNLTSGGVEIIVTETASGYIGQAGGNTIFELTLNDQTGEYEFTLYDSLDHANPNDPNDIINLHFGVEITDYDGDTDPGTITINVADDAPTIPKNQVPTIGKGYEVVDETTDIGDVFTGTLPVGAGGDAPLTIGTTGTTNITGVTTITSGGQDVEIIETPDGYAGVLVSDNNVEIFTLDIDPETGDYEFTLIQPIDHPDANDHDDSITIDFGVDVTDDDGDTDTGNITIVIKDDGPEVGDDSKDIDESNLGPITVNGDLTEDFGADGAGDISTTNTFTFGGSAQTQNGNLTSGGVEIIVTETASGYIGQAGGNTIFELTLNETNGEYEFTLYAPLDHADPNDPNDIINLHFGVEITDYDGDTDPGTITINVADDAPEIPNNDNPKIGEGYEILDETDLGPLSENGVVDFDIGGDTPGELSTNNTFTFGGSAVTQNGNLTSNGVEVIVTETATGYIGQAGGNTIFELTLNTETGEYEFTLTGVLDHADANDTDDVINLEFGIQVEDADGDSATGSIKIDIVDDAPIAVDDVGTIDQNTGIAVGNVTDNDDFSNDVDNTVTEISFGGNTLSIPEGGSVDIDGDYGTLTIHSDGSYTYELDNSNFDTTMSSLDPVAGDVAGFQNTMTKDGITVTSNNGADLTWVAQDGSGIGIAGNGTDKVLNGETLEISFDAANQVVLTVADIGANNVNGQFDLVVHFEGGGSVNHPVNISDLTITDGKVTIDLESADFGGQLITQVDLSSDNTSLLLNDVTVVHPGADCAEDQFEYTLTDNDLDSDTAVLDFKCDGNDKPIIISTRPLVVDETDLPDDTDSGTVIANFGNDGPGTIEGDGSFTGGPFTSNGQPVVVNYNPATQTYTGTADGNQIFTMEIQTDGDYTFTLTGVLDHPDATNHNDSVDMFFGVQAEDADGDTATDSIKVTVFDDGPDAHDDSIEFDSDAGQATGNVVDNDDLSQDNPNYVTKIAFEGNAVDVPQDGSTISIDGDHGTLTIDQFGDYTYTSNGGVGGSSMESAEFTSGDVAGFQNTLTKDGITITSSTGADLTWVTTADGNGVGIAGNGSNKVYNGEAIEVDFDAANTVELTIADIGSNNVNDVIDLLVYLQGGGTETVPFDLGAATIIDGEVVIELSDADFGGQLITGVDVWSDDTSLLLNEVKVSRAGEDCVEDQFVYTLTDNDGDNDTATLDITCNNDNEVVIVVNNGADSVCVKEDGSVEVPVSAQYTGGDGDEVMTLTLEGGEPGWDISAAGWTDNGDGTYEITLAAGVANYNGTFTFEPPADSDVDLTGLKVTASVFDPDTSTTETSDDMFDIHVDAVVDIPTLDVQDFKSYNWHKDYTHNVDLSITSAVTDTDGSEEITSIEIDLNNPFTNPAGGYTTLADMGVTLNIGTETSPGVWTIEVNAGDADAALDGLQMIIPKGGADFWPIHQNNVGGHSASITVTSNVEEVNLSGEECDHSDNQISIEADINFKFYITPLVLDLDGDGVELVGIDEGVMFDMNSDGILDNTSWVGSDDGLLALDVNGDGAINNHSELFGTNFGATDGFAQLALYDTNGDSIIDMNDDVFADLLVWKDANQDGVSQSDEMFSLADLDIVSINVDATETGYELEDSYVSHDSTFTTGDGEQHDIVDAWFNVETGAELYAVPEISDFTPGNDFKFAGPDHVMTYDPETGVVTCGWGPIDNVIDMESDTDLQTAIDEFVVEGDQGNVVEFPVGQEATSPAFDAGTVTTAELAPIDQDQAAAV